MRDPDLAARALRIRQHGMTANPADRYRGTSGYVHWDVLELGIDGSLPDVLAALLVEQLGRLEAQRRKREQVAKRYERAIDALEGWSRPSVRRGVVHARHLATAWTPPGRRDDALRAFARRQVGVAVHWRALPALTWFKRTYRLRAKDFPVALDVGERTISLPLWVDLEEDDVEEVCRALAEVAEEVARD
jgi:UDP-4-amino-4-deoxy-L-arabinose-oxoglutarate aminotransferase